MTLLVLKQALGALASSVVLKTRQPAGLPVRLGRRIAAQLMGAVIAAGVGGIALAPQPVQAAQKPRLVITHDLGGALEARMAELAALQRSGQPVEIRGQCSSSCTLYLGLPQTCVQRSATLGFHGPQSDIYGLALPPAEFEHWSNVMASHYPPMLRRWFMAEARNVTVGIYQISGSEAIRLGARECS